MGYDLLGPSAIINSQADDCICYSEGDSLPDFPDSSKKSLSKVPLWCYRLAVRLWKGKSYGVPIDRQEFIDNYCIEHKKSISKEEYSGDFAKQYFYYMRFNPNELTALAEEFATNDSLHDCLKKHIEAESSCVNYLKEAVKSGNSEELEKLISENWISALDKIFHDPANIEVLKNLVFISMKFGFKDMKKAISCTNTAKNFGKKTIDQWIKENQKVIAARVKEYARCAFSDYTEKHPYYRATGIDSTKTFDVLFGEGIYRLIPEALNFQLIPKEELDRRNIVTFNKIMLKYIPRYFREIGNDEEARIAEETFKHIEELPDYFTTGKYTFFTHPDRTVNIGKIIGRLKNMLKDEKHIKYLEKMMSFRQQPKVKKPFSIVISRHPVDVCTMSTGRGWSSCMNLLGGGNARFAFTAASYGILVAYLCHSEKVDIKNKRFAEPLGRTLLKPYIKVGDTEFNLENPNFVFKVSCVYGTFYDECIKALQDWINETWNFKVMSENDTFAFRDVKKVYFDDTRNKYQDKCLISKADLILPETPVIENRQGIDWVYEPVADTVGV